MTVTDCDINLVDDDWYTSEPLGGIVARTDGTTLLFCGVTEVLTPLVTQIAYGDTDTSIIPTSDIITGAVLHFYIHSYTATRGTTKSYAIWMLEPNEAKYVLIHSGTYSGTGWQTITLTAAELLKIDLGAGQKTRFRFTTDKPGVRKYRLMQIRAREYSPTDTYDMFLRITHHAPKKKHLLRLTDRKRLRRWLI